MTVNKRYGLEVYGPGGTDTPWVSFDSDTPFPAIARGDIVNPGVWEGSQSPMKVLRVVQVEHVVWEAAGVAKQKLLVFTEEVEGTRELRLGQ